MYRIKIIKKGELDTAKWSGGKTTEYYIHPQGSIYSNRSFTFRISSATIEETPSCFTNFDGFTRYLVMLDNTLDILHQGSKKRFDIGEVFRFDSSDKVESYSKGNDFNLMIRRGEHEDVFVHNGEIDSDASFVFIFSIDFSVIEIENNAYQLKKNDLLLIENDDRLRLNVKLIQPCIICLIN